MEELTLLILLRRLAVNLSKIVSGKVDLRKLLSHSKPYQDLFWKKIQEHELELKKQKQFNPR